MLNGTTVAALTLTVAMASTPAIAHETRRLDLGVRGSVVYDSNFARSNSSQADVRDLNTEEITFEPSANFDFLMPIGRQSVFLNGNVGYQFHQENERLDSEVVQIGAGLNGDFGGCGGQISSLYSRQQSSLDDIALINPKNILQLGTVSASANCVRPSGLAASFSGSLSRSRNSNPLQAQVDSDSSVVQGGLGYQRPAFGSLQVFARYSKTDYSNARAAESGFEATAIGLSFERKIGGRLQGRVEISQTDTDSSGAGSTGGSDNFSGLTYGLGLTFRATDRLGAELSFNRDVIPSTRIGKLYDVQENFSISGQYELGSRLILGLGGGFGETTSGGEVPVALPGFVLTDSKTKNVFGSLTFRQSDRVSFTLSVTQFERNASNPLFDYSNTNVGLIADVAF